MTSLNDPIRDDAQEEQQTPRKLPQLSPDEVIEALTWIHRGTSPRRPIEAALDMRDELTPRLIEELTLAPVDVRTRADEAVDEDKAYFLHEIAMYLLAAWREPQGWRLILDFFVSDDDVAMELIDIGVEADLPAMLVRCYDGSDLSAFERIIATPSLDPLFRQACVQAYHGLVATGQAPYERFIGFLRSQLDAPEDAEPSDWYDWLAFRAARTHALELRPAIEAVLDRGLTVYSDGFLSLVSRNTLDAIYEDDPQAIADDILHEAVFDDLAASICTWSWFDPDGVDARDELPAAEALANRAAARMNDGIPHDAGETYVRAHRKLGRNEPCHCGSGQKYKRCCLEDDRQFLD